MTFRHKAKDRVIDIVGTDEADPASGRIAFMAPLVRAIMCAIKGEICAFGGDDHGIEILATEVLDLSPE